MSEKQAMKYVCWLTANLIERQMEDAWPFGEEYPDELNEDEEKAIVVALDKFVLELRERAHEK